MIDNKFLQNLSQNLLEILDNDEEFYDITIEVGNDPHIKVFRAHMVILNYRSLFFRRILSTNKKKIDGTLVHIELPNILPETFQIILRYIYGGDLSLKKYETSDIIKILIAASELGLQELIAYLQSFLIENKSNWMEQNFNLIYETSLENDSFIELQKFCIELMSKQPEKIFKSLDFISISEKSLISLIQRNDLQMSEVKVWEHVLEWGIARNPGLPSDYSNYSKDDLNVLKNTLNQFIPFIKFFDLTSKEFVNRVYPYKKIIPKELFKNLIKYFLDYDGKRNKSESQIDGESRVKFQEQSETKVNYDEIAAEDFVQKWTSLDLPIQSSTDSQGRYNTSAFLQPVFGQVGLGKPPSLGINTTIKVLSGGGFARFAGNATFGESGDGFANASITPTSTSKLPSTSSSDPVWFRFRG